MSEIRTPGQGGIGAEGAFPPGRETVRPGLITRVGSIHTSGAGEPRGVQPPVSPDSVAGRPTAVPARPLRPAESGAVVPVVRAANEPTPAGPDVPKGTAAEPPPARPRSRTAALPRGDGGIQADATGGNEGESTINYEPGFRGETSGDRRLSYRIGLDTVDISGEDEGYTFHAHVSDGTLDMYVRNKDEEGGRHPHLDPIRRVGETIRYFESQGYPVERIRDSWLPAISGVPNDNYSTYRSELEATGKAPSDVTDEDRKHAASKTWTGKAAEANDFEVDEVREIRDVVEVLYRRVVRTDE